MRKKGIYYIVVWAALIACLLLLAQLAPTLYAPEYILADDFGHFWASGKLLLNRENPYDLTSMISAQVEAGAIPPSTDDIGVQTLNPPWTLLIIAPISLLDYSLARVTWLLVNIIIILISTKQLWTLYHGSTIKLWLAFLITFIFAPTFSVLSKGQVTPWVLLGITGFLMYTEGKLSAWWAGASLLLITFKPQLFYLLWPTLLLWVLIQRKWKLLLRGVTIGAMAILVLLLINSQVFSQYFTAIRNYPLNQWATPTIGSYLRYFWLGLDKFWLQYLPACLGLGWALFHFLRRKNKWVWGEQIPSLLLVSLLTTPYAWTYDQIIILPAMLVATSRLTTVIKPIWIAAGTILLGINLADLVLHTKLDDFWFLWLAPAYALWYFIVQYCAKNNYLERTR